MDSSSPAAGDPFFADPFPADPSPWRFCTAPMIDVSDTPARLFWRQLTRRARLYTEMVTTGAILFGGAERHLAFDPAEGDVALQLGGADPEALARSAALAEGFGYREVNLNCGCPSDRVQSGRFGACLMAEPVAVAGLVRAMAAATPLPVTVKHRIGIDRVEPWPFTRTFVETVAAAGCQTFIVHARAAWLDGLSPRENRTIPPLDYELVHRLKTTFPGLTFVLNGGLRAIEEGAGHLSGSAPLDGLMYGRAAWEDPWSLAAVDPLLFGEPGPTSRADAILGLRPRVEAALAAGDRLARWSKPWLGLYRGLPGGRLFRRVLSEQAHRPGAGWSVVEDALAAVA